MFRNVNWHQLVRLVLCLIVPLAGLVLAVNAYLAKDEEWRNMATATAAGMFIYAVIFLG